MIAVYAVLAIVGAIVPLAAFVPWIGLHGLDLPLFAQTLFANRVSAFFGIDVIVSAIVLFVWIGREARELRLWWLPVLATCLIGVSCGLPMFLALRERRAR